MPTTDWNDDRLDRLQEQTDTQREAISYLTLSLGNLRTEHDGLARKMKEIAEGRFNRWLLFVTAASNPLTAVIVYLVTKGKGH